MAFNAGAVIGKVILDSAGFVSGANQVNTASKGISNVLVGLQGIATSAGFAIVESIKNSVAAANTWQKSFSNVATVVDTTKINMQAMAKQLILLDSSLGDTTDLTNGLYQALSASVDSTKAVEFVAESAKFAKAALIDTNTAVDVITTGLNAYGMSADQATSVSDKFFKVIMLGKTTGQELSAVIGQSIPLAANFGISLDELGASIAVMTQQGIKSAQATTQFNAAVNGFVKPSTEMEKAIKKLGFESGSAMIKQLGFKGALDAIVGSADGSAEKLSELFVNVEGLRGVMALTGKGASGFSDILQQITDSAGSTETAFQKQEKTFDTLKNTLGKLSIVTGNIAKSFVDEIAAGATTAANGMLKFLMSAQGAEIVSDTIGKVAAGFEVARKIIEPLINVTIKEGKKIWDTLQTSLDNIFGKTKDASGGFKLLSITSNLVSKAIEIIGSAISGAIENISALIVAIRESGGTIGSFFDFLAGKKKWSEVEAQAKKAGDAFNVLGKTVLTNVQDQFNLIFNSGEEFKKKTDQLTSDIGITYKTTFTNISTSVRTGYDELLTGQEAFAEGLIENLNNATLQTTGIIDNQIQESTNKLNTFAEDNKELWEALGKLEEHQWDYLLDKEKEMYEEREAMRAADLEAEKAKLQIIKDETKKVYDDIVGYVNYGINGLTEIVNQLYDNELANIENQYNKEKATIEKTITDEEAKNTALSALDGKYAAQRAEIKRKEFEANKAAAISQAIISTANAVINVLATPMLPPVVSIPLSIAVGAIGAAQIAAIAAEPIPEFAAGGDFSPGLALVGERGPEVVEFGQSGRVFNADDTRKMLSGGNSITNNFNINQDIDMELAMRKLGQQQLKTSRGRA